MNINNVPHASLQPPDGTRHPVMFLPNLKAVAEPLITEKQTFVQVTKDSAAILEVRSSSITYFIAYKLKFRVYKHLI